MQNDFSPSSSLSIAPACQRRIISGRALARRSSINGGNTGCNGGDMGLAMDFKKTSNVAIETSNPNKEVDGTRQISFTTAIPAGKHPNQRDQYHRGAVLRVATAVFVHHNGCKAGQQERFFSQANLLMRATLTRTEIRFPMPCSMHPWQSFPSARLHARLPMDSMVIVAGEKGTRGGCR